MTEKQYVPSYISLFSAAGIGDFGLKKAGFHCIASAELLAKRLDVQRLNEIASPADLICGDLNLDEVYGQVIQRAESYQKKSGGPITLLVATPPCQGMSVANHKKKNELGRNSLVVRSIEAVKEIRPLVFVFENVPAFMGTTCTGMDGVERPIAEEIERELGHSYEFYSKVLPLQDYGSPSSRKRSITIGVRNDLPWITPLDLFPVPKKAPTLRELIGHLPRLQEMGQISENDYFHAFRPYQTRMLPWIENLEEGQSAFENSDPERRPHRIVNGTIIPNVQKNGDKYRRVRWDAVAPCVHTRNDILASQNTVHPEDNRVFSIRELMLMMGLPAEFKWFAGQNEATRDLNPDVLRRHAPNIRQCLGEAVPAPVMKSIGDNIACHLLAHARQAGAVLRKNETSVWTTGAQKAAYVDMAGERRKRLSAYYTEPLAAFAILKRAWTPLRGTKKKIHVLEPAVGGGVFLHVLAGMVSSETVHVTAVDLDQAALQRVEDDRAALAGKFSSLELLQGDYLNQLEDREFDLIIGNPPFGRGAKNMQSAWGWHPELSVRFFYKALSHGRRVAFVFPKVLLHGASYRSLRDEIVGNGRIESLLDFGELAFPDVKVETTGVVVAKGVNSEMVYLKSWPRELVAYKNQAYIADETFPTWVMYRNHRFDEFLSRSSVGRFQAWRDRTLSRKHASDGGVRVLRGRNLGRGGQLIPDERDYTVDPGHAVRIWRDIDRIVDKSKFLAPNLSYYPRVVPLPQDRKSVPEGSCAVLYGSLSDEEERAFICSAASEEFREFYRIACNYATRSINIDACLSFWWAVPVTVD